MNDNLTIKLLSIGDEQQVLDIYAPYILNSIVTFECTVPDITEFKKRIFDIAQVYPFLTAWYGEQMVGYAYASSFHARQAYNWDCELSVYVKQDYKGKKIGGRLYAALLQLITSLGYRNAYAHLSVPNKCSEKMHKKFGFKRCGVFKNSGFKFNRWISSAFYCKQLNDYLLDMQPVTGIKMADETKIYKILAECQI